MSPLDPRSTPTVLDSSENLLFQAVQEYQAALDRGDPPDRDAFLARNEEIASDLADCLDNLDFLRNIAPQLHDYATTNAGRGSPDVAAAPTAGLQSQLGDFRLIREIGRGGMGVVYEAEQVSMSRRVALKVLPFASVLDRKVLQRFHSEAQVARQLVHQHIVPVYSVGCERSVHFYAMQFIDGITLAELILKLKESSVPRRAPRVESPESSDGRDPSPSETRSSKSDVDTSAIAALSTARSNHDSAYIRSAANLMIQVARALEYAHDEGVIHRDIKPSNLIVDGHGKIWVTDFGLAHVETGPSVTITGDFLGTLRYMSPEQALAQRVLVDHRTDIYSLGLTFYELLTQRPAFADTDRKELLRQISFEEPPRPRRLNKAIPTDLETVLLKTIEKNPADRYATAGEFADDLCHFVEDRPIHARRPTVAQTASKWCRRHTSVVATTLVAFFALLVFVATGSFMLAVLLNQVAEQEKDAARKERVARTELQTANDNHVRLLSRSYVDKAQALCENGEIATGMLWLARALNTAPADATELQTAIRSGLLAWHQQLPSLRLLAEQIQPIQAMALSRDGRRLYTGGDAGSVQIFDAVSGQPLAQSTDHGKAIRSIALSPGGDYVLTASDDGTARLWKDNTLAAIGDPIDFAEGDGAQWRVNDVLFSSDGKQVISGGAANNRGKLIVCDSQMRRILKTMRFPGGVERLRHTPKGLLAALRFNRTTFQLWNVDSDQAVGPQVQLDNVVCLAISPDGIKLAAGRGAGICVWEASTGEVINSFSSSGSIFSLEFNEIGTQLLSAGLDQSARLWDVVTGLPAATPLRHQDPVRIAAFAADGTKILTGTRPMVAGTMNGTARIWDRALLHPESQLLQHPDGIRSASFSRQGLRVLTGSDEDECQLRDGVNMDPIGQPMSDCGWFFPIFQFSTDGSRFAISPREGKLQVRNAVTAELIASAPKGVARQHLDFSPDGRYLLTGSQYRQVIMWEADSLTPVGDPIVFPRNVIAKFSPDGKQFATGCFDGTVQLWDAASLTPIGDPIQHVSEVKCLAYHPEGTRVFVGCADGSARLWDLQTRTPVGPSLQHKTVMHDVRFSPDGMQVVTCSTDGMIRFWDSTTLQPVGPPLTHKRGHWPSLSFSADGRRLVSTGGEIWDLSPSSIAGTPEDIRLWTQLVTGWALDEQGQVNIVGIEKWRADRDYLIKKQLQFPGLPTHN